MDYTVNNNNYSSIVEKLLELYNFFVFCNL